MLWLWYVAPFATLVVWFLTGLPGRHEARRARELARWRALMAPTTLVRKREGYRATRETQETQPEKLGPRRVNALPGPLLRLLPEIGGGVPLGHYELVEKLAYVSIMGPNAVSGSEYQAVLAKLAKPAPRFMAYPLPIIDGARIPNSGIQFKKDPDFMALFMVEGQDAKKPDAKAIGQWLSRSVRDALCDLPDAWLYVQDRTMALVLYGPVDADRLHELVATADAIFAEHGAEGGPALLFEDEEESRKRSDDDDDDDDDDVEEEAPPAAAKAKPVSASKA
jgi:hypothetical protein